MKNRFIRAIFTNPFNIVKILSLNLKMLLLRLQGKKTIVYNIQMDYFYNTFEPIYLELQKNKKIVVYFAYYEDSQRLHEFLNTFLSSKYLISSMISPFIWFDMFITAEINGPNFPVSFLPTCKIQLYHGTGVYPLYNKTDVLSRFNVHFAVGPQLVEFLKTLPHKNKNQNNYVEVGFPKLDAICHPDPELVNELKKQYNILNEFVILYAPHWNPNGSLHVLSLEMIARLAKLENVMILIKVHNFLYTRFKEDNWQEKLQKFADKYDNVVYVTRPNTQENFPLGDMMVTDTGTTAAFEFSITKKPVFVFFNQQWFDNNENSEVEKQIIDTTINFTTIDEIVDYTRKVQNGNAEMQKEIEVQQLKQQQLVDKYLFNPGTATEAAVTAIKKEIGY